MSFAAPATEKMRDRLRSSSMEIENTYVALEEGARREGGPLGERKPLRKIIFVTLSVFMGYAILVTFQHKMKADAFHMGDKKDDRSHEFSFAVSFLYIGNLIFRMAHNFVFSFLRPRHRVYLSMGSMMVSMSIILFGIYLLELHYMGLVMLAYLFGGVSIGSFESNLLSSITPLGHGTKVWAVVGFPVGFSIILIGGFILTALGVPDEFVYGMVILAILGGMALFRFKIPDIVIPNNADTLSHFWENLKEYRQWMFKIIPNSLALMVDMFFVSLFSAIMYYIYDSDEVPLANPSSTSPVMNHDWFFAVYNLFTLLGDSGSRKLMYMWKPISPFWFLICTFVGGFLCLTKIGYVVPVGIFLVFFGNGAIYATTTRRIDQDIPKTFNLIALSFWLFVGDIGSVTGSNLVAYIRDWTCPSHFEYVCVAKQT